MTREVLQATQPSDHIVMLSRLKENLGVCRKLQEEIWNKESQINSLKKDLEIPAPKFRWKMLLSGLGIALVAFLLSWTPLVIAGSILLVLALGINSLRKGTWVSFIEGKKDKIASLKRENDAICQKAEAYAEACLRPYVEKNVRNFPLQLAYNYDAVSKILEYFEYMRVSDISSAINLYYTELHQQRMEAKQDVFLRSQDRMIQLGRANLEASCIANAELRALRGEVRGINSSVSSAADAVSSVANNVGEMNRMLEKEFNRQKKEREAAERQKIAT